MNIDTNLENIAPRLIAHMADVCDIAPGLISSDTTIQSIGFDSLSLPRVLNALEIEFLIQFHEDDVSALLAARTIGEYIEVIAGTLERSAEVPP